ncbi:polysaccharide biosynthesis/export family protein [Marinifilum sp. D737]|uniref:polysaccharide biosynthesis/export family protein n=1 Tax=Marinifilum sp. D737 TaxID=2969628 RepID=UPI00227551CB|nr:polysaccharide biosynthesis/export family protein [Marinifilum sp. D737]MCY1633417.1 polysaccharide biosynthesis/export family protein [Marinifilum sp. D737]
MNKKIITLMSLVIVMGLISCRSNQDLVYLQDVDAEVLAPEFVMKVPEYKIKTNDNLFVSIKSMNPEISQLYNPAQAIGGQQGTQNLYSQLPDQYLNGYQVDSNGNISLPIIGSIGVAGLTQKEAQEKVQEHADEYLKDASVKVKLLNFRVTVMGEVATPGVYYNYNSSLSILEALSMANGITDHARINRVLVIRTNNQESKTYRLDLSSKNFLKSEAFFIQPNDVIYVEPHKIKNTDMNSNVYSLLLSTVSTAVLITSLIISN